MSSLQKAPRGLLGALNLKQLGINPTELAADLRATYDATDLYNADLRAEVANSGINLAAAGDRNNLVITFTNSQAFLMTGIFAGVQCAVGDAGLYVLGYRPFTGASLVICDRGPGATRAAAPAVTYTEQLFHVFERGVVLLPGASIEINCIAPPAAARSSGVGASGFFLP